MRGLRNDKETDQVGAPPPSGDSMRSIRKNRNEVVREDANEVSLRSAVFPFTPRPADDVKDEIRELSPFRRKRHDLEKSLLGVWTSQEEGRETWKAMRKKLGFTNNLGKPDSSNYGARLNHIDGQQRLRAVSLLLVGSLSGFFAFFFAAICGLLKFGVDSLEENLRGELFSSGYNYYPQTVSEMVHDRDTPSGKCFFGFCLIGAICILSSWYPWQLRNVWVGDAKLFGYVRWLTLRQFLPPIGLLVCASITSIPPAQANNYRDRLTIWIHTAGAMMMTGGYIVVECHALFYGEKIHMSLRERCIRKCLILGCFVSGAGFQTCGLLSLNAERIGICCMDIWHVPTKVDIQIAWNSSHFATYVDSMRAYEGHVKMLYNTAHGPGLLLKMCEFWFEVFAGLFLIASHLAIWFFCPERQYDINEVLPDAIQDIQDDEARTAGSSPGKRYTEDRL